MGKRGPEGKIQDEVIKYAREEYGALCKKKEVGRYFVQSGWPDYAIYPDKRRRVEAEAFFIEFKAPGEVFSPLQAERAKELRAHGYMVYVVDNVAKGKIIIDKECS